MASLRDLARKCDRLPRQIKIAAANAAIEASKRLLERLWADTPVDTSKALSNWLVGIGKASQYSRMAYVEGFAGYTANASTAAARVVAFAALERKKPGQVIHITNNVNYINKLNAGSSKQAPPMFIESAVFAVRYSMRGYRLNLEAR